MLDRISRRTQRHRGAAILAIAFLVAVTGSACQHSRRAESPSQRDLSVDEANGGHTLARHVGKTDEELQERLRLEPNISSASTYTDRAAAESVVGAALASAPPSFNAWLNRAGRRPNFVLRFAAHHPIGRSLARGRTEATPCEDALIVVRWDERLGKSYVLTSYPEAHR
jgi:hypothetical protein